jgi:hypothetical protein
MASCGLNAIAIQAAAGGGAFDGWRRCTAARAVGGFLLRDATKLLLLRGLTAYLKSHLLSNTLLTRTKAGWPSL